MLCLRMMTECAKPPTWENHKHDYDDIFPFLREMPCAIPYVNINRPITITSVVRTVTGLPLRGLLIFIPTKIGIALAKKELLGKNQIPKTLLVNLARRQVPVGVSRVKACVVSPELWLSLLFGAATRIASRFVLTSAFTSTHGVLSAVAGLFACAGAGVMGGAAACLVGVHYRNMVRLRGCEKEFYFGRALFESALGGLLGGALAGFAAHAGSLMAKAGRVVVAASAGAAAGILHAGKKEFKTSRGTWDAQQWQKFALQGAAFGTVGGVMGIVAVDLFGVHQSVAAPTEHAGIMLIPTPEPPLAVADAIPSQPLTVVPSPVACSMNEAPLQHCLQTRPVHHYRHLHHHYTKPHLTPVKLPVIVAPPPIIQNIIILVQPGDPPPPMPLMPPPLPLPIDPCSSGDCGAPCDPRSQLDIQGPCGDPDMPCDERVSFDAHGDATKVVLEPRATHLSEARFEADPAKSTKIASENQAAGNETLASNSPSDTSAVSLVVPFVNHIAT